MTKLTDALHRHSDIIVIARPFGQYGDRDVQKKIYDQVREIRREEGLSCETVIKEMSLINGLPNLKIYIPVKGHKNRYQRYITRTVTLYRRLLAYQLQVNTQGYPKHIPRQLSNVMDLDIYIKARQKILNRG